MNCPYCQTKIKNQNEAVTCTLCGTPHHKDCWSENGGCTTYGCLENPNFKNNAVDVGNLTVAEVQSLQGTHQTSETIPNAVPEDKTTFEDEFKRRYKENIFAKRRQNVFLLTSISILAIFSIVVLFSLITKLNSRINSEDYKIKEFIDNWKTSWENKNMEELKNFYDKDYIFVDKDLSTINLDERLKRISQSFKSTKKIKITISELNIAIDSTEKNYANVTFNQLYKSDKVNEAGKKNLRLFRTEKSSFEWKIFREFYE
jgi:hypothetical protein